MSRRSSPAEIRGAVHRCIEHLDHALQLARIAVQSDEPERAALYIADTLRDLAPDVRTLRRATRSLTS